MGSNGSRIKYVATFLGLTLLLVACSGSDGDGTTATTAAASVDTTVGGAPTTGSDDTLPPDFGSSDDPLAAVPGCDLLTDDEIATVTGAPVTSSEEIGVQGCHWFTENQGEVRLNRYAGGNLASGTCDGQMFFMDGDEEEIQGLGDQATWGSTGILVVCRSDVVMKIDVDYSPNTTIEEDRDSAIAMARSVFAQMDG